MKMGAEMEDAAAQGGGIEKEHVGSSATEVSSEFILSFFQK